MSKNAHIFSQTENAFSVDCEWACESNTKQQDIHAPGTKCLDAWGYQLNQWMNNSHCIILRGKLKEAATGTRPEYEANVHRGGTCDPSCLNSLLSNSAAHGSLTIGVADTSQLYHGFLMGIACTILGLMMYFLGLRPRKYIRNGSH